MTIIRWWGDQDSFANDVGEFFEFTALLRKLALQHGKDLKGCTVLATRSVQHGTQKKALVRCLGISGYAAFESRQAILRLQPPMLFCLLEESNKKSVRE